MASKGIIRHLEALTAHLRVWGVKMLVEKRIERGKFTMSSIENLGVKNNYIDFV